MHGCRSHPALGEAVSRSGEGAAGPPAPKRPREGPEPAEAAALSLGAGMRGGREGGKEAPRSEAALSAPLVAMATRAGVGARPPPQLSRARARASAAVGRLAKGRRAPGPAHRLRGACAVRAQHWRSATLEEAGQGGARRACAGGGGRSPPPHSPRVRVCVCECVCGGAAAGFPAPAQPGGGEATAGGGEPGSPSSSRSGFPVLARPPLVHPPHPLAGELGCRGEEEEEEEGAASAGARLRGEPRRGLLSGSLEEERKEA